MQFIQKMMMYILDDAFYPKEFTVLKQENEHLKKRINETIQTNEMADAYLRSLLQNRPK